MSTTDGAPAMTAPAPAPGTWRGAPDRRTRLVAQPRPPSPRRGRQGKREGEAVTPSKVEATALLALIKWNGMTCALLGNELWHNGRGRGNCSCPFARPAGAVVKRLRAMGFAEKYRIPGDPRTFYRATWRGDKFIRTDADVRSMLGLGAPPPGGTTP